jgi:PAS domain S-box-containing protein
MTDQRIRVLLVEDEAEFADTLREILAHVSAAQFEVAHATNFSELLARLRGQQPDVILLDLSLPDRKGLEAYGELKALAPSIPVVILTGLDDERLAVQAVRTGAQDYLVKGQFDGRLLSRVIRYALERKRVEEALRQSEEFFRLISENVTDLIAVLDEDGKRLYNSASYRSILGEPARLRGSDSFEEIHPEDRERVKRIFRESLASGVGERIEYRFLLKDGTVRQVESQGSVIHAAGGRPPKLVVVSRDITERKEAVEVLRTALADLKKSHDELNAAQLQLIQSERLEAVSTFAAGVAHEVKNPLQTLILGIDYLSNHVVTEDKAAAGLLAEMGQAVRRADGIIRGLVEFSAQSKREIKPEDLTAIVVQSLQAIAHELSIQPVRLVRDLAAGLPLVKLDAKALRHVFISLFMNCLRAMPQGGMLSVRTFLLELKAPAAGSKTASNAATASGLRAVAEVQFIGDPPLSGKPASASTVVELAAPGGKESGLGLSVLRKIIGRYGGTIDWTKLPEEGNKYTIMFKP